MQALLHHDGELVAETPLAYAGATSKFAGKLKLPAAGELELTVLAMDPERANFGWAKRRLTVAGTAP